MIQRYVNISFVFTGILVWILLGALFGALFGWIVPDWNFPLIGERFALSDLLGLATGLTTALVLRRTPRVNELALEIGNELKKVTWPSWKETRVATIVVLVTTFIVAAILGFFDAMWSWATSFVYDTGRTLGFFSVLGLVAIIGGSALLFYYASKD